MNSRGTAPHYVIIFLTGAATLALELLSSRVLTPYFGVSLYIWSSILAITLTFLALGYYGGGWLARRADGARRTLAFFAAPALSVVAVVVACLIYPWLFPWLAGIDLLFGSIVAAALILAVPLVVLSAMNPLLIAVRPETSGDAGAGRVFFVSTVGSVAGVIVDRLSADPLRDQLPRPAAAGDHPGRAAGGRRCGSRPRSASAAILAAAAAAGLILAGGLFAAGAEPILGKTRDLVRRRLPLPAARRIHARCSAI